MIKAIFFLSIISYWNVIGGPPPIIAKITFTEEELVIDGTQLEDTKSVSIKTLENKILKDYEVDNANSEKIVARPLAGSFEPGDKNLYLVITDSEGELFYPITLRSKTSDQAVYKITPKKNAKIPNKIEVDEKSEINFSPGDNSGRYYYNYSIYANPVGDLAIKNDNKDLFKIDQEGNLEILGSLKVKGKTLKFNNGVINTLNFENFLFPVLPTDQRGDFRVKDVIIGADNNISGVVDFTSSGDMDVATATFHVESSTGRVGIGNATPTYKLDVQGASNSGIRLRQAAASTNTSGAFFNGMVFEEPGLKSFGIGYGAGDLFSINSFDGTYRNIFSLNNVGNGVIAGSLKIGAYTLPSTDGTNGQVLSTNGAGTASWTSAGAGIGDVVGPASSTVNHLASFSSLTGKAIKDSGINSANLPTMVAAAASSSTIILSGGPDKTLTTTDYTLPSTIGSPTYVLKSDGTNAVWEEDNLGTQSLIAPTRVNPTGLLPMFLTSDGQIITDSDVEAINVPEMTASPTAANQIIISTGNGKHLTTTIYPISPTIGATGTVLKSDGSGAFWQPEVSVADFIAGPATATINSIARFESEKVIKESGITIDDLNNISGVAQLNTKVADNLVIGTGIGVDGNLPIYVGLSPTEIEDSGISLANIPTMATGSTGAHQIIISTGPGKGFTTTVYPIADTIGASDTVLKSDGTGASWQPEVSVANFTAGPSTSTLFALPRYADTTGKILKDSPVVMDDAGNFNFLRVVSTTEFSHPCPSMTENERDALSVVSLASLKDGDCIFNTDSMETNFRRMGRWGALPVREHWVSGLEYKKADLIHQDPYTVYAAKDFTAGATINDDYFAGNFNFPSLLPVTTCTSRGGQVTFDNGNINVVAGNGLIITKSTTGHSWPDENRVKWNDTNSIPPVSPTSWNTVYVDKDGVVKVTLGRPNSTTLRTEIVLATFNPSLSQIIDHRGSCFDPGNTIRILNYILGKLIKGFEYFPNAGLTIGRSAGEIYGTGINFDGDIPNVLSYPAQPTSPITYYFTRNSRVGGEQNNLDPQRFDPNNGTLINVPKSRWTYQRIYLVYGGTTAIQYGQKSYQYLNEAISAVTHDALLFEENPNLSENAKWIATIVMKEGTANLNITDENALMNCGIFGCSEGVGGGTAAGGGGGGDVFGPTSSVINNLATFSDVSGKLIEDSGINALNLATMAATPTNANQIIISAGGKALSSTIYQIPPAIGATGTVLKSDGTNASWETDLVGTGDVVGPASASSTNLAAFNGPSGKLIQDSGIIATNVVTNSAVTANNAIPRFSGTMGTIIQNSGVTIDGSNNISGILNISVGASATINGALIINNNGANSSAFPTTRGSNGQGLITNGSGTLSWGDLLNAPTSTDKTGAYTIAASDCQNTLTFTSGAAANFTVPNTLPVGCQINIVQMGTAQVSFVGSGITVTNGLSMLKTRAQFSPVTLLIVNSSYGILGGDVGN